MGLKSIDVKFVSCVVHRENLAAPATLLESGEVRAVVDKVYPLADAANAASHMLGHHSSGNVVISMRE